MRLLLEEAGAEYVDVARRKGGIGAMMRFLDGEQPGALPFAAPFVKVDGAVVSQTANILAFLAPRFAKFWLPDAFVFIDSIPRTSTGKLKKSELRERYKTFTW